LAEHTSPDAHAAHLQREKAADVLTDSAIRDELTRQATQVTTLSRCAHALAS
jgi:hypothetical protein